MPNKRTVNRDTIFCLSGIGVLMGLLILCGIVIHDNVRLGIILIIDVGGLVVSIKGLSESLKERAELIKSGKWN